jgi:hypothetical protein
MREMHQVVEFVNKGIFTVHVGIDYPSCMACC